MTTKKGFYFVIPILFLIVLYSVSATADTGLEAITKVNSICNGVDSINVKDVREAVKNCNSMKVITAVLYYHPDFGARYIAAKKVKNRSILKIAYQNVKLAHVSSAKQKRIKKLLIEYLKKRYIELKQKSSNQKTIEEIDDLIILEGIIENDPDYKRRYRAVKRSYNLIQISKDNTISESERINGELRKFKLFLRKVYSNETRENKKDENVITHKFLLFIAKLQKLILPSKGKKVYFDSFEFLKLLNNYRKQKGLQPIKKLIGSMNNAALKWAQYHYDNQIEGAHRHNGSTPLKRARKAGYNPKVLGENMLRSYSLEPEKILGMWIKSEKHNLNLLNPDYTEMGIACAYAPIPPKDDEDPLSPYVCIQILGDR